jgi:hypothetical protein
MTLLDRLRAAQAARPDAGAGVADGAAPTTGGDIEEPALVGLAVLSPGHLDAMKRVLTRERSTFPVVWAAAMAHREVSGLLQGEIHADGDLDDPADPVPAGAVTPLRAACPNCRGDATVTRVDLTENAGWFECRACGLRWGGAVTPERERLGPLPR